MAYTAKTGRSVSGYEEISFSATPVFVAEQNAIFKITLTGNVTSSTITNPSLGQYLRFVICQDATGSRTFAWPASFVDAPTVHTTANACQLYIFTVESTGTIRFVPTVGPSGGGGAVASVFGRTGAVTAAANDYGWTDISGKPSTFAPSAHTHPNTEVTGLGTASTLNVPATGDAAVGEVVKGTDTRLTNTRAPSSHTHAQSDITNLVTDLSGKQASLGFTPENAANKNTANGYAGLGAGSKITASQISAVLASSDLTNDSALEKTGDKNAANGYAGLSAGSKVAASQMTAVLASSDLTNDAALEKTANKAAANGYAGLGANSRVPTAQLGSGTADATTFLRGDQTYAAPGGGSDPWT